MFAANSFFADKNYITGCILHWGGQFDNLRHFKDTEQNIQVTYTEVTEYNSQEIPEHDIITGSACTSAISVYSKTVLT